MRTVSSALPRADVILLLGCRIEPTGMASAVLERRIALALRAYRQGVAHRIIATGGRRWRGRVEALVMRAALVAAGVPATAITVETHARHTRDNCRLGAAIVLRHGWRSVLVATSGWHLPRAMRNLRRHGVCPVPPPASWLAEPRPSAARRLRELLSTALDAAVGTFGLP